MLLLARGLFFSIFLLLLLPSQVPAKDYRDLRARMVADVAAMAHITHGSLGRSKFDAKVMTVMGAVRRHLFVPDALRKSAYRNRPLPIGYGQTISQPYIVALMTDLLDTGPEQTILEVGTGSGYQAAVLSKLVKNVFTIEIVTPLGQQAKARLARLEYKNVTVRIGDGYYGWKAQAPFDAIIVTAAGTHIPPPLVRQLKNGGRMVIPVGQRFEVQHLTLIEKDLQGKITIRTVLPVSFVPLTGGQ